MKRVICLSHTEGKIRADNYFTKYLSFLLNLNYHSTQVKHLKGVNAGSLYETVRYGS
ncbi:MAG: hypothetical protein LE179_04700 [Endomicrobium sp.]|nr:hypothetical protein [Endomicrobium sp.]